MSWQQRATHLTDEEREQKEKEESYYLDWLHSDEGKSWTERYHPELIEDTTEEE